MVDLLGSLFLVEPMSYKGFLSELKSDKELHDAFFGRCFANYND